MADCNAIGWVSNAAGCAAKSVANGSMKQMADGFMNSYDSTFKSFMTSWLGKGVMIDLDGVSVNWFQSSVSSITAFLVTIGLIIAGVKVMRDANGAPIREAIDALGRVIFVSVAGVTLVQVVVVGFDALGKWLVDSSGVDKSTFTLATTTNAIAPGLGIILGFFGILTVVCQWALMLVRGALLPLLLGFWPVAAGAAMLNSGRKAFEGITRWIIAFVIYTPVAAGIYALAWRMKGGEDGIAGVINGWCLIVLAIIALPAIMRLLQPATAALGRAAGGAMALGITSAVVAGGVAVGAAVMTGGGSAAAGAGGTTAANKGGGTSPTGGGPDVAKGSGGGDPAAGGPSGMSGQGSGASVSDGQDSGPAGGRHAAGTDGQSTSTQPTAPSGAGSPAASGNDTGSAGGQPAGGSGGASSGSKRDWARAAFEGAQGAAEQKKNDGTAEGMFSE